MAKGQKNPPARGGGWCDQNTLSQSSDMSELSHIETGRMGWFSWSPTEYGSRLSVSCWLRFGPCLRDWSTWLAAIRSNCSRGISGWFMVCSGGELDLVTPNVSGVTQPGGGHSLQDGGVIS